jgi:hypothetical protein
VPYLNASKVLTSGAALTFNGTVLTSSFAGPVAATTLSASSTVSGAGFSTYLASPPAIGGTLAAAGSFTTLTTSSTITHNGGTANGVAYLNGSKVLITGSALTFDGSTLTSGASGTATKLVLQGGNQTTMAIKSSTGTGGFLMGRGFASDDANTFFVYDLATNQNRFYIDATPNIFQYATAFAWSNAANSTEYMRLTSTGLGIGTSSPTVKLEVNGAALINGSTSFARVAVTGTPASGTAALQISINSVNARTLRMEDTLTGGHTYDIINGGTGAGNLGIFDDTAGAYRLVISSAGNLGLGVTPSAWVGYTAFDVSNVGCLAVYPSFGVSLFRNAYYDGTNYRYKITSSAAWYDQDSAGKHIWYNAPSGTAGNAITFTQAMTLDASGSLVVGGTSALAGSVLTLQETASLGTALALKNRNSTQTWKVAVDAAAVDDKILAFIDNGTSTVRMALTDTGNLGLGVTPSAWSSSYKAFQIQSVGRSLAQTGAGAGDWTMAFNAIYSAANSRWDYAYTGDAAVRYSQTGAGIHAWYTSGSSAGTAGNPITFTQAMTLDASGNLLVGKTTTSAVIGGNNFGLGATSNYNESVTTESTGTLAAWYFNRQASAGAVFEFRQALTAVGSITVTSTLTLYNTTSDQRLKENIQDAASASALIDSLQVRQYNWKSDGSHQRYGFVAQELVTVAPEAVHQPADPEAMMAVDYSKLVPMLVKEIQDLRKRLAALEAA